MPNPDALTGESLIDILGSSPAQDSVKRILGTLVPRSNMLGENSYAGPLPGIYVRTDKHGTIRSIYINSREGYQGAILRGLSIISSRDDVRRVLGPPASSPILRDRNGQPVWYDRWVQSTYAISVYYDAQEVSYGAELAVPQPHEVLDLQLSNIGMRNSRETANTNSNINSTVLQGPEVHADARAEVDDDAGHGDNLKDSEPSAGFLIVSAWLDELEAHQPNHGELLQATLDAVGELPAAYDDGCIYTVSHNRYWVAHGFASTCAKGVADMRRQSAVIGEMEAQKRKDEPRMVVLEQEGLFWESIRDFVESAGAARMAPPVVPAWLESLNPKWKPSDD
jgi:hypothetical protein